MTPQERLYWQGIEQRLSRLEQAAEKIIEARRRQARAAVETMAARHRARMAEQRRTELKAQMNPLCGKCSAIQGPCQHHSAMPRYMEQYRLDNEIAKRWS